MRSSIHARARASLSLACLSVVTSCLAVPESHHADEWPLEILAPEPAVGAPNLPVEEREADEGFGLFLMVSSTGMNHANTEAFVETLQKNEDGKVNERVGHCWIVLDAPGERLEGGHSGEYGKARPTYQSGVLELMDEGDPNPARYLWEEMPDGVFLPGSGGLRPTYGAWVPLSRVQHAAIRSYVDAFDFREFALRGKGCSQFAVGAARLAGLELANLVRLRLPPTIEYMGRERRLWSDPAYGSIVLGSPDVLEDELRALVADGSAVEALARYLDEH